MIGVTGGVGSGKTAFVHELVSLGAKAVDADALAGEIVDGDDRVRRGLKREFGADFFDQDRGLKRRELANKAFSEPRGARALNRIVWPSLLKRLRSELTVLRNEGPDAVIVLDMAVLLESGAEGMVDRIVVVEAPKEERIRRLAVQRGWSRQEAEMRMRFQMPDAEKEKRPTLWFRTTDPSIPSGDKPGRFMKN